MKTRCLTSWIACFNLVVLISAHPKDVDRGQRKVLPAVIRDRMQQAIANRIHPVIQHQSEQISREYNLYACQTEILDSALIKSLRTTIGQGNQSRVFPGLSASEASHARFLPGDIISDPLYQQPIKRVLSEESWETYQTLQKERVAFRLQAIRRSAVAALDSMLLMSESRRQQADSIASEVRIDADSPGYSVLSFIPRQLWGDQVTGWQEEVRAEFSGRNRR